MIEQIAEYAGKSLDKMTRDEFKEMAHYFYVKWKEERAAHMQSLHNANVASANLASLLGKAQR